MIQLLDVLNGKQREVSLAKNACAIDIETGQILYDKKCYDTIVPMSVTKLMTILTALKYIKNVKQEVTVIIDDIEGTKNTSGCLFSIGDSLSIIELIHAALLPSSN